VVGVAVRLFVVDVAAEGEGPRGEAAGVRRELVAERRALGRGAGERVRRGRAAGLAELLGRRRRAVEVDVAGFAQLVQPVDVVVQHLHRAVGRYAEAGAVEAGEQVR